MQREKVGERVELGRSGGYREIVLDRPERRNAIDVRMRDELIRALRAVLMDEEAAGVGLLGRGPSFCSGGDLTEFGAFDDPALVHLRRVARSLPWLVHEVSSRLVVGVHGACIGAGVELAAFARRVIAAPDARFSLPEVGMGLLPGMGGTVSVPARVGRQRACWLMVTGESIDATTAREWGLVDEIVSADHLATRVREIGRGEVGEPTRVVGAGGLDR